mmetsp:Transcript_64614/g.121094  ORF Transcript_64614/g.121094 Transcript_64614/m.121094 type:complete len:108 (-) Transcript_64614:172-495(-)
MTNYDFYWHDVRGYSDSTGGFGVGHPRRLAAQQVFNASEVLTSNVLWEAINTKGDFADIIFQAIINVEQKLWNISITTRRAATVLLKQGGILRHYQAADPAVMAATA